MGAAALRIINFFIIDQFKARLTLQLKQKRTTVTLGVEAEPKRLVAAPAPIHFRGSCDVCVGA